jgi:hypothetical protein
METENSDVESERSFNLLDDQGDLPDKEDGRQCTCKQWDEKKKCNPPTTFWCGCEKCGYDATKSKHMCMHCKHPMMSFCCENEEDDEGYGSKGVCEACKRKGKTKENAEGTTKDKGADDKDAVPKRNRRKPEKYVATSSAAHNQAVLDLSQQSDTATAISGGGKKNQTKTAAAAAAAKGGASTKGGNASKKKNQKK